MKTALRKDGWTITHDPFQLSIGKTDLYVDLGAERLIALEKAERKIAVEVKSFVGRSDIHDLHEAMGKYTVYRAVLSQQEVDRALYRAISVEVFDSIFEEPLGRLLLSNKLVKLLVFEPLAEVIHQWIA